MISLPNSSLSAEVTITASTSLSSPSSFFSFPSLSSSSSSSDSSTKCNSIHMDPPVSEEGECHPIPSFFPKEITTSNPTFSTNFATLPSTLLSTPIKSIPPDSPFSKSHTAPPSTFLTPVSNTPQLLSFPTTCSFTQSVEVDTKPWPSTPLHSVSSSSSSSSSCCSSSCQSNLFRKLAKTKTPLPSSTLPFTASLTSSPSLSILQKPIFKKPSIKKSIFKKSLSLQCVSRLSQTKEETATFIELLATGGQAAVFLARSFSDQHSLLIVKVFYKEPKSFELECLKALNSCSYSIKMLGEIRITKAMLVPYEEDLKEKEVALSDFVFGPLGYITGYTYERLYGDLEKAILKKRRLISFSMKCLIALQIAYFLKTLHKAGFIFRDLKPANVLLNVEIHDIEYPKVVRYFIDNYPVIKVADFSLVTKENLTKKSKCVGTIGYMPSSQIHSSNYDCSVDVTAYAITIAELFLNDLMFDGDESDEKIIDLFTKSEIENVILHRFASYPYFIPSEIPNLICNAISGKCTSLDPFISFFVHYLKCMCSEYRVSKSQLKLLAPEVVHTPTRQ